MKSRKLWVTSVLSWHSEQQQQDPILETEKLLSSQYECKYKQNLMIKLRQMISE